MPDLRRAQGLFPIDGLINRRLATCQDEDDDMQFRPCISGQCTTEGTHCEGCGRSHEEIAETRQLIMALVDFARRQGYENVDDFSQFVGRVLLSKLQATP